MASCFSDGPVGSAGGGGIDAPVLVPTATAGAVPGAEPGAVPGAAGRGVAVAAGAAGVEGTAAGVAVADMLDRFF